MWLLSENDMSIVVLDYMTIGLAESDTNWLSKRVMNPINIWPTLPLPKDYCMIQLPVIILFSATW